MYTVATGSGPDIFPNWADVLDLHEALGVSMSAVAMGYDITNYWRLSNCGT